MVLPSLSQVQKYLGNIGVFLYIPIVFLILLKIRRYYFRRFLNKVTEGQASRLTAITLIGLIVIFFIVYPIANSGIIGGGTDREEDLNIATIELLHGRYPYYPKTSLNHPLSHLPGSLLLSIPFVLLGNSAYQNFFWFFLFVITAGFYLKDRASAIFLFWITIILSPVVMQEFVTGGDLVANSIYVCLFIFLLINSVANSNIGKGKKVLSSVLLGIGLSSRVNYILLLPLVFSTLAQNAGWKPAVKYTLLTCLTFFIVTIPFFLYDPKGFSPVNVQFSKINQLNSISPFIGIFVVIAGGIIAVLLSFQRMDGNCIILFRNCAFVEAFLILCAIILDIINEAKLNLGSSGYGFSFLFFGTLTFWHELTARAKIDKPFANIDTVASKDNI